MHSTLAYPRATLVAKLGSQHAYCLLISKPVLKSVSHDKFRGAFLCMSLVARLQLGLAGCAPRDALSVGHCLA